MSEKSIKESLMVKTIHSTLIEYPELLNTAISAICEGIRLSIENVNKSISNLDTAFLCCLGMLDKSRKSKKLIEFQNDLVLKHLKSYGGHSLIEKEVIAQLEEKI